MYKGRNTDKEVVYEEKTFDTESPLPWDFINIGVDKEWFKSEYKTALSIKEQTNHIVPTCEKSCVNCGVCKNLQTHKILAKPYKASEKAQQISFAPIDPHTQKTDNRELFRYRIKLTKTGILRYFSHLDWQNTFLKALSRSGINIAFSQGFNPTMKVSMGVALPLFAQSVCELVDIETLENYSTEEVQLKLEKVLPKGSEILSIVKIDKSAKSIDTTVQWAEYEIKLFDDVIAEIEVNVEVKHA